MRALPCSCLLVLSLFALPAAIAQDASSAPSGGVELPGNVPLRVVVNDASYALALEQSGASDIPSAREKLLVVEIEIENLSDNRPIDIRPSTLRCSAIDRDDRFGEAAYDSTTGYRLAGTTRSGNGRLGPGQTRKLYTGIFVAAASTIDHLELRNAGGDPVRVDVGSRIRPLPRELTDSAGIVADMIPAVLRRAYVLGPFDISAQPMERQPIEGDDRRDRIILPLTIHNRLEDDSKLNRSLIPAYITDGYGERHEAKGLVKGNGASASNLELAPGQTLNAGLEFVVPKAFVPAEVAVFTRTSRGTGHRYILDLAGGGGGGASGEVAGKYDPTDGAGPTAIAARPSSPGTSLGSAGDGPAGSRTPALTESSTDSPGSEAAMGASDAGAGTVTPTFAQVPTSPSPGVPVAAPDYASGSALPSSSETTIAGTVTYSDGQPAPGIRVSVLITNPADSAGYDAIVFSRDNGTYEAAHALPIRAGEPLPVSVSALNERDEALAQAGPLTVPAGERRTGVVLRLPEAQTAGAAGTSDAGTGSGLQPRVPTQSVYPVPGATSSQTEGLAAVAAPTTTPRQELEAARQSSSDPEYTAMTVERTLADEGATLAALPSPPADASSGTTPAAERLPAPVRNAVFDLQRIKITRQHEARGDEYYLVTYPFRGLLGAGNRIYTFDATRQIRAIAAGDNWAKVNAEFQIPAAVGKLEFPNLQPYEVYGFIAIVMEADGNTNAEREAAFGWGEFQGEDGVLEVLAALFDRAIPRTAARPAYEDRTCEVVRAVDYANRRGLAIHIGPFGARSATAQAIEATLAAPMKRADPDDFDGWFGGFYANLPGGESCFVEDHTRGGTLFPPPGRLLYTTRSTRVEGEHRLYE